MNNYLLDTQVFIWWMEENKRLSPKIKLLIDDPTNSIFISVATPWEMVIKIKTKNLKVPKDFANYILSDTFEMLSIEISHALEVGRLPAFHKDPFDRILISQAKIENLTLISSDKKIWKYNLPLLKA